MGAQIRLPNPAHDRPPVALTTVAALVGLALGVTAVVLASHGASAKQPSATTGALRPGHTLSAGHESKRQLPGARPTTQPAPIGERPSIAPSASTPAAPTGNDTPTSPSSTESAPTDGADASNRLAAPEPSSTTAVAVPREANDGPASRVTRVVPGRVAYVRCEGLSVQSGPYPCPRDRVLEAAVWDLLDTLRQCRGARPTPDERGAELRVTFQGSTVSSAEFRAPTSDHRRLEAQLDRCLRASLQHIETKLRPVDMVVSFRFQLL